MSATEHAFNKIVRNTITDLARIHELETTLNRMIEVYEDTLSDSDGRFPGPDAGCPDCTRGTVPDKFNSGPCAYHTAKRLLGQL
jgi:hypothetical protein